jgi:membrane protein DedA with SNARE-associated domain
VADWVIDFIGRHGYWAVAALMLAENLFPPFPSELIMPFAGFQAARGQLHWALVILCGSLGSVVGALPWYVAGRALGLQRVLSFADAHGRWLTLSRKQVEEAERWFAKRGPLTLVIGRLVPAIRTVISLPAGICRMALARFCLWSAAGSILWCSVLTAAGYLLEAKYDRIAALVQHVSTGVLVVIVALYLWRVVRFRN